MGDLSRAIDAGAHTTSSDGGTDARAVAQADHCGAVAAADIRTHARADDVADLEADAHSHARSASDADGDNLPQRRAGRDGDRRGLRRAVVPAVRAVELVRSRHGLSDGRVRELGVRARADTRAERRADAEPERRADRRADAELRRRIQFF